MFEFQRNNLFVFLFVFLILGTFKECRICTLKGTPTRNLCIKLIFSCTYSNLCFLCRSTFASLSRAHDILHKSQSGFRKHHSCNTALINLVDKWLSNIDKGEVAGAIYFTI